MAEWWRSDQQLQEAALHLGGADLAAVARTCRFVAEHLRSPATLRWIAALRGLLSTAHVATLEHIELAEAISNLECSISFHYGDSDLDPVALPNIQRFASLLQRHPSLTISVEAHCGLEAPTPAFARHFTRQRAESVKEALVCSGLGAERVRLRAWGCSRPLVWAHGEPAGSPNRRVEIFISNGDFEAPARRPLAAYAVAPGAPPLSEEAAEADGACGGDDGELEEARLVMFQLPGGQRWFAWQQMFDVGAQHEAADFEELSEAGLESNDVGEDTDIPGGI